MLYRLHCYCVLESMHIGGLESLNCHPFVEPRAVPPAVLVDAMTLRIGTMKIFLIA